MSLEVFGGTPSFHLSTFVSAALASRFTHQNGLLLKLLTRLLKTLKYPFYYEHPLSLQPTILLFITNHSQIGCPIQPLFNFLWFDISFLSTRLTLYGLTLFLLFVHGLHHWFPFPNLLPFTLSIHDFFKLPFWLIAFIPAKFEPNYLFFQVFFLNSRISKQIFPQPHNTWLQGAKRPTLEYMFCWIA